MCQLLFQVLPIQEGQIDQKNNNKILEKDNIGSFSLVSKQGDAKT